MTMTRDALIATLQNKLGTDQAEEVMQLIDDYTDTLAENLRASENANDHPTATARNLVRKAPPGTWTAKQVADFLNRKGGSTAAARATIHRWGIKAVAFVPHPKSKKPLALYPADKVRAEHATRRETPR